MSSSEKKPQNPDSYLVNFEHRTEYLYAYIKGKKENVQLNLKCWSDALAQCKKHKYNKLLIEEDIEETPSASEVYEISKKIASLGFDNILIAFVDRRPEHRELNKFGELVAANRGVKKKVFNSLKEAQQWLLNH